MIEHADHYVPRFVKAGANSITVHVEPGAKHDVGKRCTRFETPVAAPASR
jgi:Pentose-5-phosphate-3-epimerase